MKRVGDHWEYLATYVNDILVFSKDPMDELKAVYTLKGIGELEYYLGGDIAITPDTKIACSAKTYIERAVTKYEALFEVPGFCMYSTPMTEYYYPELDESDYLTAKEHSIYRGLIGSATWIVTLGRMDIHYAVNTLSRFSMAPRQSHLTAMIRVFGYLKQHTDFQITADPSADTRITVQDGHIDHSWTEFYPEAQEELPPDMPTPLGNTPTTYMYVDADHARD
jgi:hypothetical protein